MIRAYRSFPKTLFRLNHGPLVTLRPWEPQRGRYDIFLKEGHIAVPCAPGTGVDIDLGTLDSVTTHTEWVSLAAD